MEGPQETQCFPRGTRVTDTKWKCLLDPIDGTRGIMYDKRSAWALSGIAPQRGSATRLSDIFVAAMTEIPTSKQWRADQVSCTRGGGIVAEATNVLDGSKFPLSLSPSGASTFRHGFAWMAKFFPEGRALTAQIEEQLWDELIGLGRDASPTIFDDQYICSGGSFYELLAGHDRMIGDLRPLVLPRLNLDASLVCHPYDVVHGAPPVRGRSCLRTSFGGFSGRPARHHQRGRLGRLCQHNSRRAGASRAPADSQRDAFNTQVSPRDPRTASGNSWNNDPAGAARDRALSIRRPVGAFEEQHRKAGHHLLLAQPYPRNHTRLPQGLSASRPQGSQRAYQREPRWRDPRADHGTARHGGRSRIQFPPRIACHAGTHRPDREWLRCCHHAGRPARATLFIWSRRNFPGAVDRVSPHTDAREIFAPLSDENVGWFHHPVAFFRDFREGGSAHLRATQIGRGRIRRHASADGGSFAK